MRAGSAICSIVRRPLRPTDICVLQVTVMDLATLTFETAKALEGTEFKIELPDGTVIPMKLDEVLLYESRQRRRSRGSAPRREPFSMYFIGPPQPILPQAMYTLRGEAETFGRLFIVPIGQDGDGTDYEAVFN